MSGPGFIGWAVETLIATTLLMALVLVLRGPVRKSFGPHMAYALWSLPVIRLLLPPLPGDWQLTRLIAPLTRKAVEAPGVVMGVMNPDRLPADIDKAVVAQINLELAGHHAAAALVPPTQAAGGPSVLLLLVGLWVAGACAFLAYHLIAHSRFCRNLLARARIDRTVAQGKVRVIETDAAHGPLAFGIFRKYVAFPRDFSERYDEVERNLALAHELGHHVRGDLAANWVALFVLAIHWFNPVAWKAFRAFRADQEMACDALVLAGRAQALRHAYGRAIVKSAHGGAVSAACHLHTINELKGRLRMLSNTRKNSPMRIGAGVLGVTALSLAALGLTASGSQAAESIRVKMASATGIGLGQDVPAPPAAPEPPAAVDAPEAPEAPEAPDAPEAPAAPHAPVRVHVEKRIVKTADGKQRVIVVRHDDRDQDRDRDRDRDNDRADTNVDVNVDVDTAAIERSVPEIRSRKCGGEGQSVITTNNGGRSRMVICIDRIERMASDAAARARVSARDARASARAGLRAARDSIRNERHLSEEARREALAGIDEAMRDLDKDMADN